MWGMSFPTNYMQLFNASSSALKAVDPGLKVSLGLARPARRSGSPNLAPPVQCRSSASARLDSPARRQRHCRCGRRRTHAQMQRLALTGLRACRRCTLVSKVGGPATAQLTHVTDFVQLATEANIAFDFVSTHMYAI